MYGLKIIIFFISVCVFFQSCKEPEEYPIVPSIELQSFNQIYSTEQGMSRFKLNFRLVDGDGDIGYKSDEYTDSVNLYIKFFELVNDSFVVADNYSLYKARIPYVQPEGANKAIKADISMDVELINFAINDTFKFEFFIKDRSYHKSNVIVSPAFIRY